MLNGDSPYEGTPADEAEDKRGAAKLGMSHDEYERSSQDALEDQRGAARMNRAKAAAAGPQVAMNTTEKRFAFCKPHVG